MSIDVNEVLRRLHTVFRNCLNFQSISPHLRLHYLLTDNEWEVISKKDSREDQVDEFLKCLPHKGKGCLERLKECLQLSLDHSGHQDIISELNKVTSDFPQAKSTSQDEFERAVNTINTLYSNQKETMATLVEKLDQQESKIKQLELTCDDQATTIQQLHDTVANQKVDITNLNSKLQEKEKLLNSWSSTVTNGHDRDTHHYLNTEVYDMSPSSSQDSILSNDNYKCGPPPIIVNDSSDCSNSVQELRLSPNTHSNLARNPSIEDRMKQYRTNLASYRKKCHQLEEEKARLKEYKDQLEREVAHLREELDRVSLNGSINSISFHRQNSLDSGFPVQNSEPITMPILLSDDMYLHPVHQGWLTKEGGNKKSWRKRWCVLSLRFFFYFEDDKVQQKKPMGIIPLTKNMEVTDCRKDNIFEVHEKSGINMKSCKLDKNRGVYIPGNHAVYNLQASCDENKKEWIKKLQAVFENLKLSS